MCEQNAVNILKVSEALNQVFIRVDFMAKYFIAKMSDEKAAAAERASESKNEKKRKREEKKVKKAKKVKKTKKEKREKNEDKEEDVPETHEARAAANDALRRAVSLFSRR